MVIRRKATYQAELKSEIERGKLEGQDDAAKQAFNAEVRAHSQAQVEFYQEVRALRAGLRATLSAWEAMPPNTREVKALKASVEAAGYRLGSPKVVALRKVAADLARQLAEIRTLAAKENEEW